MTYSMTPLHSLVDSLSFGKIGVTKRMLLLQGLNTLVWASNHSPNCLTQLEENIETEIGGFHNLHLLRCLIITYNVCFFWLQVSLCITQVSDMSQPVPGKFLDMIVGQDASDSKSNRLHVDIFRFCFHSFEVYSCIDSCKMIGKFPEVSNFNRLFLEVNRFVCN